MPLQTITIHRHGGRSDTLDGVDCLGDWAIHETLWCDRLRGHWCVIHVPSGRVAVWTRTRRAALAARRAFVGCGLSWQFAEPGAMTAEQREMGRTIKREWEGR